MRIFRVFRDIQICLPSVRKRVLEVNEYSTVFQVGFQLQDREFMSLNTGQLVFQFG